MLKIYNSLSHKKEQFIPRKGKKVNMFVCGITPYNSPHIGNLRTCVNYDVIARYLTYLGYKVYYLQNVTDIDDKIINAAKESGIDWNQIADKYFKEFLTLNKQLNVKSVSHYAKATKYIKQIIAQIQKLIKKGFAYERDGSVYFEVKKFKKYGALSHQNLKKLHTLVRIEKDTSKKHPYDFVLWKTRKEKSEPSWKSPWGQGRPGWHIEDTAISDYFFGAQYDIHGGAIELQFPHHEAEIAQAESASSKTPFVKYWVHCGILNISGSKMSKSLGNFITGKDFMSHHDPQHFRLMLLSSHYRSPINYSEKLITQASTNLEHIKNFIRELKGVKNKTGKSVDVKGYEKRFFAHLDDDFNTPLVLSVVFSMMRTIHPYITRETLSQKTARDIILFFKKIEPILGIAFTKTSTSKIPGDILKLAQERKQARTQNKWTQADKLRKEIQSRGYEIKDLKEGYKITKIIRSKI